MIRPHAPPGLLDRKQMPENNFRNRRSFDENIEILLEELKLATEWTRPSILLAVCKSRFIQSKAEQAMEVSLRDIGQRVIRLEINKEHADIVRAMVDTPHTDQIVFFVSNLDWGGGQDGRDAFRALNIYRELLVENKIKAIFWLTAEEASHLPMYAPDFWAFRHQAVEFSHQRVPRKFTLPAGALLWHMQEPIGPLQSAKEKILSREKLLLDLPEDREALSARIETLYQLGYLYWHIGESAKALELLNKGLDLAAGSVWPDVICPLLNGTGIVQFESGKSRKALETYEKASEMKPGDGVLLVNLSVVLSTLGKNQEAILMGRRATKTSGSDPRIWNCLGLIYSSMGKFNEAIIYFKRALELAPKTGAYHETLAICYSLLGQPVESAQQIEIARQISGESNVYLKVGAEAILGNTDQSLRLLKTALDQNQISKTEIRRSPNLNLIFSSAQIEKLL
jgi:Tfp pilus assembly protein PilF